MAEVPALIGAALLDPTINLPRTERHGLVDKLTDYMRGRMFEGFDAAEKWPYVPTHIEDYAQGTESKLLEDWVIIPGVGSHCGPTAARLLKPHISPKSSIGFFDISPNGTNQPELTYLLQNRQEALQTKRQNAYCHSLGLLRFLSAVRDTDDIVVGGILADGAPSSRRAIRYYRGVEGLVPVLDHFSYQGGLLGKFTIALFKQVERYGFSPINERVEAAKKDTVTGANPRRHVNELREVRSLGKAELLHNWWDFEGKITPDTHIGFCHAEDHSRDHSVHLQRSIDELGEFAEKFNAKFTVMPVPDSNHANTDKSIKTAEQAGWFEQITFDIAA